MLEPLNIKEESGKVIITISGPLNKDTLELLSNSIEGGKELIKKTSEQMGRKIDVLLDMSAFDGTYDVAGMEAMAEFAKHNSSYVERTAAFGGVGKAVAAGEVTAALAGRGNIQFFPEKEDALAWLGTN